MHGSIGYTRRDRTPRYWRSSYQLNRETKNEIEKLHAERERLFREFEALPDDIPDHEYTQAEIVLRQRLDALIGLEDKLRRSNLR
ncbi:MAG: hypothetical protein HQP61_02005 [Peptococcaceae bacterium]|nr:hypothetical protein [Candidatus Syntrophopropionicum ammoniitolerans]